jgi:pimeloyl-ACP methyl ester carboxylesterase
MTMIPTAHVALVFLKPNPPRGTSIAAQYGLDTLAGDVATVRRTLGRVSSPSILVGHSYGGTSGLIMPA